ncbi:MAG: hypothetical protein WCJ09_28960 [Planctomycetota bacterium]
MIQIENQPRHFPVELAATDPQRVQNITADAFGLRLQSAPAPSPLAFESPDGSVGRLTLPRGFAVDHQQRYYFAQRKTGVIWYFDPQGPRDGETPFQPILKFPTLPISNDLARLWSLAANSQSLFIVRPGCDELVSIALGHWAIQDIDCFNGLRDVATFGDDVYVLINDSVFVRRPTHGQWTLIRNLPSPEKHDYVRLLFSTSGELFVHCNTCEIYSVWDNNWFLSHDRTLFPVPPVVAYPGPSGTSDFQYLIPGLSGTCDDLHSTSEDCCIPPELSVREVTREMLDSDDLSQGFLIREDGTRVRSPQFRPSLQRLFLNGTECGDDLPDKPEQTQACGSVWYSTAIDSRRYRCNWDRIEVQLWIPAGCRVVFSTLTLDLAPDPLTSADLTNADVADPSSEPTPDVQSTVHLAVQKQMLSMSEPHWSFGASFEATSQRLKVRRCETLDFPVRSKPGQFLFVRVKMSGDGFSTPVVRSIMAKGPRQSYVEFLPAVMREDDDSRDFLERFVSVFQTEWDSLETQVREMDRMFNPAAVNELQLGRLANWFGISLPAGWKTSQYRSLLKFAPDLLMAPADEERNQIGGSRRGTVEHIRNSVRAVLGGLTGLDEQQMRGFPWIIEGFRERSHLTVKSAHRLGDSACDSTLSPPITGTLWSPDSTGQLQLGDNSVLGERKLLPNARSELEMFRAHAHRIRVVIPACWVPNHEDRCAVETMIEAEKPAHVVSEITLVRPGMCIGLQSTVGVDTILGEWSQPVLNADPAATLGLGRGMFLPESHERPPPMLLDVRLGNHSL